MQHMRTIPMPRIFGRSAGDCSLGNRRFFLCPGCSEFHRHQVRLIEAS